MSQITLKISSLGLQSNRKQSIFRDMKTIDMTPRWEALIPVMVTILRNPKASIDSVRFVQDELVRIARAVDKQNEEAKKNG